MQFRRRAAISSCRSLDAYLHRVEDERQGLDLSGFRERVLARHEQALRAHEEAAERHKEAADFNELHAAAERVEAA